MTELPTDPVAAARLARDALETAAAGQAVEPDPDRGQFYGHGREIVGMLTALDDLTSTLTSHVDHYGDQRQLRDDAGAHPEHRLASAHGHLVELHTALRIATRHADQFRSAIGHIHVDPHALPDEQE